MTGIFEARIALTIFRIEESRPPGVSIVMSTAASRSWFADSMPSFRYDASNGSTTPFRVNERTVFEFDPERASASVPAAPARPSAINRRASVRMVRIPSIIARAKASARAPQETWPGDTEGRPQSHPAGHNEVTDAQTHGARGPVYPG